MTTSLKDEELRLSPDTARKLFDNGGVFVIMNLPIGSVFGIDMKVFTTGEKFRGIKMIPPGLHFIYYSIVSKEGVTGPRTGFFHYFGQRDIVLRKWDKLEETVSMEPSTEEEINLVRNEIQHLDPYLGAYPYQNLKHWNRLTCNINEILLNQLQPLTGIITSVTQLIPLSFPPKESDIVDEGPSTSRGHQSLEEKYLPQMKQVPGTEIRFTKIPEVTYPAGSSASEITKHSMDSTFTFESLLQTYSQPQDILGELQLALICFLIAHVYDAFEHWKKLLTVICSIDSGIERHVDLIETFLTIIHFQIKEIPTDFFEDITCDYNFLVTTLHILFENVKGSDASDKFKKFVANFQKNMTKTYKWDFESVPDDELPVVVEM